MVGGAARLTLLPTYAAHANRLANSGYFAQSKTPKQASEVPSVRCRLACAGRPTALDVGDRLINQTGVQERLGQRRRAVNEQRANPTVNQRRKQIARLVRGTGSESEHLSTVPSGCTFFEPVIITQDGIVDEPEIMDVYRNLAYRGEGC